MKSKQLTHVYDEWRNQYLRNLLSFLSNSIAHNFYFLTSDSSEQVQLPSSIQHLLTLTVVNVLSQAFFL